MQKASKNVSIALLAHCTLFTLTTLSMELPTQQLALVPKPTILADLYINPRKITCYTGKSLIKKVEKIGIKPTGSTLPHTPFIPICMVVDKENGRSGHLWEHTPPRTIQKYELEQIKEAGREMTEEDARTVMKKMFPHSLPADFLFYCDTETKLHFTAYGYPVVATCCKQPPSNKPFAENFKEQIDRFKAKPDFISDMGNYSTEKQELIDAKIFTKNKHHGRNGFVSMEALFFENKKKLYGSQFNYVMQRKLGVKPRAHASSKKIEKEDEESDESSSSQEEPEACTIS